MFSRALLLFICLTVVIAAAKNKNEFDKEAKRGTCPPSNIPGTAGRCDPTNCQKDKDCQGDQKCCKNQCNKLICTNPLWITWVYTVWTTFKLESLLIDFSVRFHLNSPLKCLSCNLSQQMARSCKYINPPPPKKNHQLYAWLI